MFFGDKILHLESDFRKFGSVAVLRSLIRILRASLAQIDTEMAEKYAKLAVQSTIITLLSYDTHYNAF